MKVAGDTEAGAGIDVQPLDVYARLDMATALNLSSTSQKRFYLPELDSLRFFAFLSVFVGHAFPGSWLSRTTGFGVDLFFALSAYLITELLLRERDRFGTMNVRAFLMRRVLRIWPLYFGMLGVALALHRPLLIPLREIGLYAIFLGNFAPIMLDHSVPSAMINALWTVSIEEQFYLSWPVVMRRLSRSGILKFAIVLFICCAAARAIVVAIGRGPVEVFIAQATPCRVDAIAVGVALSVLDLRVAVRLKPWLAALSLAAIALAGAWIYLLGGTLSQVFGWSVVALACGALLLATIDARWMRFAPMCYLGRISYGLYVFHGPALLLARIIGFAIPLTALLSTIGISMLSYRYLETPFLRLKSHFERISSRPI